MKTILLILATLCFISCVENNQKRPLTIFKYEEGAVVYLKNEPVIINYREELNNRKYYHVKLLHCKSADYYACQFTVGEEELIEIK